MAIRRKLNKHQKRLINASKIANQCRRNWAYEKFNDEDLQTITSVATNMPTKQNVLNFELVVSTNVQVNEEFYRVATSEDDRSREWNNGQVNAPLLYIWCNSPNVIEQMEKNCQDESLRDLCIGISSGAAALTATFLGYETGFCRCFEDDDVERIIKENVGIEKLFPKLMLGVGHPKLNSDGTPENRSKCFIGGDHMYTTSKHSFKLQKIHYI